MLMSFRTKARIFGVELQKEVYTLVLKAFLKAYKSKIGELNAK